MAEKKLYAFNPDGSLKWVYSATKEFYSSPAIGDNGTIYISSYNNKFYAIEGNSTGLADTPCPKFAYDSKNTEKADTTPAILISPLLYLIL